MNMSDYLILHLNTNKSKRTAWFVLRNDMDVNEHERLPNITLRHKLK